LRVNRRLGPAGDYQVLADPDIVGRLQVVGRDDRLLGHMMGTCKADQRLAGTHDDVPRFACGPCRGSGSAPAVSGNPERGALKDDRCGIGLGRHTGPDKTSECDYCGGTQNAPPTALIFPHFPLPARPPTRKKATDVYSLE
jgi:hypothetical protein